MIDAGIDKKVLDQAVSKIDNSKNILLVTHDRPDGDAIGSMTALHHALSSLGKNPYGFLQDEVPRGLWYVALPGKFNTRLTHTDFDLVFALDAGELSRTGINNEAKIFREKNIPIVNIDHHPQKEPWGDINLVLGSEKTSSTSEIIYYLLDHMKVEIDRHIATAILTGIYTDTESFTNSNTHINSIQIAGKLIAKGARLAEIRKLFNTKEVPTLMLWGKALSRVSQGQDGIVSTVITQEDLKEHNAEPEHLEGIANFLNCIPEARATLLLSEKEDNQIKGSLRTQRDDFDVSSLAQDLGGGGHKKASGFKVEGKIEEENGEWKIRSKDKKASRLEKLIN